jgi:membrane protein DedA with SNARE-associated domain
VLTSVAAAVSSGPPVLPGFLAPLDSPLAHYGLWAIALFVLLEDFGIPVPGETVLIAGAVFAGSGRLNIVAVGVVGFLAAVAGDNIGYAIGRFGGRALVERWGRYVFLTKERLDKAERFFARHGGKIIVVARFVEGLRQANGIIAGIIGMRWLKFLACNALGAALWVGTWVSVGYFAGQHITAIYDAITNYSLYVAIVAVVLIAAWIVFHLRERRRRRGTAAAETRLAKPAGKVTGTVGTAAAAEAAGTVDAAAAAEATETVGTAAAAEAAGTVDAAAGAGATETVGTGAGAEAAGTVDAAAGFEGTNTVDTAASMPPRTAGTAAQNGSADGQAGQPATAAGPALARRDQDSEGSERS